MVLAAGLLAHLGALGATFYMDDHAHIGSMPAVQSGRWWDDQELRFPNDPVGVFGFRKLTYALWATVYALFGLSPVAFHAVNLLLHLSASLVVFWAGRELLRAMDAGDEPGRGRAALAGALIFAVHPILTEGVNYAQNASLQLVTLFTLLGAGSLARARTAGDARWLAAAAASVGLASYSKEVGIAYSLGTLILIGALLFRGRVGAFVSAHRWAVLAGGAVAAAALVPFIRMGWAVMAGAMNAPLWANHFFTQGRVFWMYLARIVWPADLAVDHHLQYSGIWFEDPVSAVAAVGVGLVAVGAGVLAWRRRTALAGTLGLLFLLPLLARFLHMNNELMVEYRLYPAFPWLAMLAGIGWAALAVRIPRAALPAGIALILGWAGLSAIRNVVWGSERRLALDSLRQYPKNMRVRTILQRSDFEAGDWEKVRSWRTECALAFMSLQMDNLATLRGRRWEIFLPWECYLCSEKFLALTIAETRSSREALDYVNRVLADVRAAQPGFFENVDGHYEIVRPLVQLREFLLERGAEIDARRTAAATAGTDRS